MLCAEQGIHVLLFGPYPWSRRISGTTTPKDLMSRAERIEAGDDKFWEKDLVSPSIIPPLIRRVDGWKDVLAWVQTEGTRLTSVSHKPPVLEIEELGESVRVE